jgi:hypothetical protein
MNSLFMPLVLSERLIGTGAIVTEGIAGDPDAACYSGLFSRCNELHDTENLKSTCGKLPQDSQSAQHGLTAFRHGEDVEKTLVAYV